MSLDYRLMGASDWFWLSVVALLCVIAFLGFWLKPILPWRSVHRLQNPDQTDEDIGQPTRLFLIGCKIFGLLILLLGVAIMLLPFLPLLK